MPSSLLRLKAAVLALALVASPAAVRANSTMQDSVIVPISLSVLGVMASHYYAEELGRMSRGTVKSVTHGSTTTEVRIQDDGNRLVTLEIPNAALQGKAVEVDEVVTIERLQPGLLVTLGDPRNRVFVPTPATADLLHSERLGGS